MATLRNQAHVSALRSSGEGIGSASGSCRRARIPAIMALRCSPVVGTGMRYSSATACCV